MLARNRRLESASGTAEAIVDITTTGATLAANELKTLVDGTILKSQAQLAAALKARWSTDALKAAETLTARIAARELARASKDTEHVFENGDSLAEKLRTALKR